MLGFFLNRLVEEEGATLVVNPDGSTCVIWDWRKKEEELKNKITNPKIYATPEFYQLLRDL